MGKKFKTLIIFAAFLFIFPISLFAGLFDNYDFTYYKTISHSLAKADKTTIGIDYTGFGFVGGTATDGIFVRMGFQLPYMKLLDSIITAFENRNKQPTDNLPLEINPVQQTINLDEDETFDETKNIKERDFTFTLIFGPAKRIQVNEFISLYFGTGFRIAEKYHMQTSHLTNVTFTSQNITIGADFDIGARMNINNKTSFRYGVYGSYDIISFKYDREDIKNNKEIEVISSSTSNVNINILNPYGHRDLLNVVGYVSLGRFVSSVKIFKEYTYEITSRNFNTGKVTIIEEIQI